MVKQLSTLVNAVMLTLFLSGCAKNLIENSPKTVPVRKMIDVTKICPQPTSTENKKKIMAELSAVVTTNYAVDTLAIEWERLNDGAIECRKEIKNG